MAFPSREQRDGDPQFLRPFDPAGFERPHFLFRIDNGVEGDSPRAIILVQSDARPDWDYAFQNTGMFLTAPPEVREFTPAFSTGDTFRFRIHVNLSKKSAVHRTKKDREDATGRPKTQGKRVSLTFGEGLERDAVIREWFASKGAQLGFTLHDMEVLRVGWVAGFRPKNSENLKFRSALLEGTLAVSDEAAFERAVSSGIGAAKAFGFGLLSVSPVRR